MENSWIQLATSLLLRWLFNFEVWLKKYVFVDGSESLKSAKCQDFLKFQSG